MHLFFAVLNMSIAAVLLLGLVLVWRWGAPGASVRRVTDACCGFRSCFGSWFRTLLPSALSVYNLFHRNLERPGGMLLSVTYLDTALTEPGDFRRTAALGKTVPDCRMCCLGGGGGSGCRSVFGSVFPLAPER